MTVVMTGTYEAARRSSTSNGNTGLQKKMGFKRKSLRRRGDAVDFTAAKSLALKSERNGIRDSHQNQYIFRTPSHILLGTPDASP